MQQWQKILAAAGSAAGVAAALYCLFKEDEEPGDARAAGGSASDGTSSKVNVNDFSPEDVLQIINDLNEAQQKTKASMANISKKISDDALAFPQIYELVKEAMPEDPLQARGLAPPDFEALLMKNQRNEAIMTAFSKFSSATSQPGGKELSVDTIVEVGKFISQEFDTFIVDFQGLANKASYDMQVVLLVSQVVLNAKLTQKYGVTSEDYEGSMGTHQQKLMSNQAFLQNFMEYQQKMEAFMKSNMR
eukprot:TRINITY_DN41785_c0_g1_i1.p1 TRINITY_DN41785_c0_g1~~TRINITY_DN41785_c0_g1_i1.p1  ORF type:complete len:247 (-),score=70.79 TRINITY_DN41785_c0_g1_i1:210-950(-)